MRLLSPWEGDGMNSIKVLEIKKLMAMNFKPGFHLLIFFLFIDPTLYFSFQK